MPSTPALDMFMEQKTRRRTLVVQEHLGFSRGSEVTRILTRLRHQKFLAPQRVRHMYVVSMDMMCRAMGKRHVLTDPFVHQALVGLRRRCRAGSWWELCLGVFSTRITGASDQ